MMASFEHQGGDARAQGRRATVFQGVTDDPRRQPGHAGYAPDAALAAGDDHELIDELHYYHVLIDQLFLFKFYNDHHIFIVQLHIFNFYDDDHILIDQFFHFHDHDEHLLIDQLLHFNEDDHILIDQLYIFHIYHFGDKHNNQHFGQLGLPCQSISQIHPWLMSTSTTTTTSSFLPEDVVELLDLLNRQRKNEAAGAVRDVASSEEEQVKAQVSALLEAANQSEGAIPQVTNETDTGTVTVMAFTSEAVEAARRTGAAVPVSTGGADAAEVPSQVLAQAMEMAAAKVGSDKAVVLSLTAINDATAEKLQQRPQDGKPIEIDKPLREPIKLRFEVNNSDPSLRCAFWDEIEAKWSEEGLKTVSMDGKQLECETVHLSIFAAVVFSIENVAACSTAMYLLSDEGFRNLFDVTGFLTALTGVHDLIRTIVVSFVCLCLGDLMILLLTLIGRRSVATSLCVVYILLFLSNMHPADVQKWFESSAWSLAQGLILKPLAMSLVMNTLLSIALSFSRVRLAIKTTWLLKGIEVHMTPEEEDQLKRAFEEAQQNQESAPKGDGPTSVFSMLDVIREDSTAKGDMTYTDALQMTRKIVIREDAESRVDEEVKEPPRVKRKVLRRVRRRRHPNLAGQVPLSNIEQGQSPEVSAAPIVKRKVLRDRRVKRRRHPNLAGQAPLSNIEQGQSPEGTEQLGMCAIVLDVEEEQEAGQAPLSNVEQGQSPEEEGAETNPVRNHFPAAEWLEKAGEAPSSNITSEQGQVPEDTESTEWLGMCAIVLDVEEEEEVESVAHLSGTR
eukprot:g15158.t2